MIVARDLCQHQSGKFLGVFVTIWPAPFTSDYPRRAQPLATVGTATIEEMGRRTN